MIAFAAAALAASPTDACAARTRAAAFDAAVADAELAVRMLDVGALVSAIGRADGVLPCVEDPLYPDQIARYYRARGTAAIVRQQGEDPVAWFRAARDAQPAIRIDDTLGAVFLDAWNRAIPSESEVPLPAPDGSWSVDGRAAKAAPTDHPWLLQWLGTAGEVRGSAILDPGVVEPPWGIAPFGSVPAPLPGPSPTLPPPLVATPKGHPSRDLLLAGFLAGALGGAGIAQAADWRADFLASDLPSSEQRGLLTANRVVGYSAGGLAVVSIGLGVSAVAVGRW